MSRYFFVLALLLAPAVVSAQTPAPAPVRLPPAGSAPVVKVTEIRFHPINESIIEPQTYLYYIQTPLTRASEGVFVPFNEATEKSLLDDFKRLWATGASALRRALQPRHFPVLPLPDPVAEQIRVTRLLCHRDPTVIEPQLRRPRLDLPYHFAHR